MLANIFINPKEHRLRAPWRLLLQWIIFFGGNTIASVGIGIGAGLIMTVASGKLPDMQSFLSMSMHPLVLAAGGVSALLFMLLSYWVAARWLDRRQFRDFGFHFSEAWWLDLGFGLFLGAFLMVVIFAVERAAGWVVVTGSFQSYNPGTSFWGGIFSAAVLFLCVGIYEEMLSRGYQLRNLAEGFNVRFIGPRGALLIAYLLSSSFFGLLHIGNPNASWVSTANIVVAGLFLGLGYLLTGELAIPIGLHITWNFFQGSVFGFPVSGTAPIASIIAIQQRGPSAWTGGAFGPEGGLIGLLAIALGCLMIILWVRWRSGQAVLQDRLAVYTPPQKTLPAASAGEVSEA